MCELLLLEIAALMYSLSLIGCCNLNSLALSRSCSLMMISLSLSMDRRLWLDEGAEPSSGGPACCVASVAQAATASLYDFLEVGDVPDKGGLIKIMSIVFLMI